MKKIVEEKKLYNLYLDLYYAVAGYKNLVNDAVIELKDYRASLRKAKKRLSEVEKFFEKITGKPPTKPKRL